MVIGCPRRGLGFYWWSFLLGGMMGRQEAWHDCLACSPLLLLVYIHAQRPSTNTCSLLPCVWGASSHLSLDAARPSMALAWKHVRRSPLVSHTWPSRDTLTTHPEEPHPRTRASGHPRNLSSQQEMLGRAQPPVREAQGRASKWRRRRRRPKRGDLELGAGSLRARLERLRPEPTPSSVGPGPRRQDGPQQKGTKQDRRAKGVVRSR